MFGSVRVSMILFACRFSIVSYCIYENRCCLLVIGHALDVLDSID